MQYKKASLLGDKQYGKKNIKFKKIDNKFEKKLQALNGQALHAKSLGFLHPKKKKIFRFETQLPKNLKNCLNYLKNKVLEN